MTRLERSFTVRGYEVDASGQVPPATLFRYLEHLRWESIQEQPGVGQLFSDGNYGVVVAQRLVSARPVGIGARLEGAVWPGKPGRSSVEIQHELRLAGGELVARGAAVVVHLDATGKPRPLPEALRAEAALDPAGEPVVVPAPEEQAPPAGAARQQLVVRPSELDSLRHVNHACYVAWCDDLRRVAATAGQLGQASARAAGRVHALSVAYRREARLGDSLEVSCWPLADGDLACEVRREDETLCRARLLVD